MKQLITRYLKPLVLWLVQATIGLAFVAFIAFMLIEWASGCGEHYVDSKGVTHINECTFTTSKKGTI
jgi:hypothetical protein